MRGCLHRLTIVIVTVACVAVMLHVLSGCVWCAGRARRETPEEQMARLEGWPPPRDPRFMQAAAMALSLYADRMSFLKLLRISVTPDSDGERYTVAIYCAAGGSRRPTNLVARVAVRDYDIRELHFSGSLDAGEADPAFAWRTISAVWYLAYAGYGFGKFLLLSEEEDGKHVVFIEADPEHFIGDHAFVTISSNSIELARGY